MSGMKKIFSARSKAQAKIFSALPEVQTIPPFLPQNALILALELT